MGFYHGSPGFARRQVLTLALGVFLAASWECLGAADDAVLARGKGVQVTQVQLDEAFVNLRATLSAQGRDVPERERKTVEEQLVEKLALTQLLLGKSTQEDRKTARQKVDKLIQDQKTRSGSLSRFEAEVRAAGLSPETFEKDLLERAICEEVLDRELRPQLGVTPEKIRSYYDRNPTEFRQPERVRLQQVVLSTRQPSGGELGDQEKAEKKQLAGRLLERLRKGEDISVIARDYSDDPVGRDRNGEYIFPVGRMVAELEAAVIAMPTNQVSEIITTPYAYHLVKVIERLPGDLVPFDSVTNRIASQLELSATQAILPEYQKRLFTEAGVDFVKR